VVVIYAKGPEGNPLWDYAVRRGWEENIHVVTDPDELIRLALGRTAQNGLNCFNELT
jgi:hypothetical protein